MSNGTDHRDRVASLRQLGIDSLSNYRGGFAELQRIDQDVDSIIQSLDDIADPFWVATLFRQWGQLEIMYALALADERFRLTQKEEVDAREIVSQLLALFRAYKLPLNRDEKPRENDVVQLLRPLPEHDLPAGSKGTVVVDYPKYSDGALPAEYEVEFAGSGGSTQALLTVSGDDLQVVWRPGYGESPAQLDWAR
jgi:hypothetical protein